MQFGISSLGIANFDIGISMIKEGKFLLVYMNEGSHSLDSNLPCSRWNKTGGTWINDTNRVQHNMKHRYDRILPLFCKSIQYY